MADCLKICVVVLAAGQSRRFGDDDKLAAEFCGTMLGLHICQTLQEFGFGQSWVVAGDRDHPCGAAWQAAGFEIAVNERAESGMGSSVALAAKLAAQTDADALLICLADMPLVTAGHLRSIISGSGTNLAGALVASSDDKRSMPPALFGRNHWPKLAASTGDQGARDLLSGATQIAASPESLIDIDDQKTLNRLQR